VQPLQQAISNFRRTKAEKTTPAKKPPTVFGSGIHFFAFDSFDNVSDEAEDAIVGFFFGSALDAEFLCSDQNSGFARHVCAFKIHR
jgi:hypothetical protein